MDYSREVIKEARRYLRKRYRKHTFKSSKLGILLDALTVYEKLGDFDKVKSCHGEKMVELLKWLLEDTKKRLEYRNDAVSARVRD